MAQAIRLLIGVAQTVAIYLATGCDGATSVEMRNLPPPEQPQAQAQVAFDAGSEGNNSGGDLSRLVIPHTTGAGSNRALYCTCCEMAITDVTATYAGEAMDVFHTHEINRFFRVFRKLNPATGTNNVVCPLDNQPSGRQTSCICGSFTGVDQGDPDDAVGTDVGAGTSSSVPIRSAAGGMVLDVSVAGGSVTNFAQGGSQTLVNIIGASARGTYQGGMSYWAGDNSRTMTSRWTEFQSVSAAAWNINAASRASSTATTLLLLGLAPLQ